MKYQSFLRSLLILVALVLVIAVDSWLLLASFEKVREQQALVRQSYRTIDQFAVITSRLRDAEMEARGVIAGIKLSTEDLAKAYATVQREVALASGLAGDDSTTEALIQKLDLLITHRRDELRALEAKGLKVKPEAVASLIKASDLTYAEMAAILGKLKEIEEANLQVHLAPQGQLTTRFYLAAVFTGLLNLLCGLLVYRQTRVLQRKQSEEAAHFEQAALEMNESAEAASLVGGEIETHEFARAVVGFFSRRYGAVAVNVYAGDENQLRSIESESSQIIRTPTKAKDLIRETLLGKQMRVIGDVPADYWRLESGLGESTPKTLLLLPLRFQEHNVGLIEVALFQQPDTTTMKRIENILKIFAVSLGAAESRRETAVLLAQTLRQSTELQSQQEELRSSNEELEQQALALEAQQEALVQKNREHEKIQLELEKKAQDLALASKYKTDFLAKMSHELRTPLNGLLILSTLLVENKEKTLTAQQQHFAKSINTAGHDLLTLINDILDLSKLEARKLIAHPTRFTLGELFDSKRRTFEPQTNAKNLELITDLTDELRSVVINTDRQRLDQILRNFLGNAVKFTDKGSVKLTAELNQDKTLVTFAVKDTGIGIPREKQKLIFEAFEQSDTAVSAKYGGTGLGLSISKELAGLLGGEISLSSRENQGSEFRLTLPLNFEQRVKSVEPVAMPTDLALPRTELEDVAETHRSLEALRETVAQISKEKKTILIVEDDDAFRQAVATTVRRYGFEPVEVNDGSVAVTLLNFFTPDAILLDIKLPGISGLGILEVLKRSANLRHIPVHMISGLEYQTNALRMGALGYLTKPVTIEKIGSAIERIETLLSQSVKRILVVEDNTIQNEAVVALFEGNDVEVASVKTGRAALHAVTDNTFDCIVLDLTLPDVSGFDLLAELSQLAISIPPIVIYTGKELSVAEQDYLRKYSDSIVIKGARSPDRLLDEVNLFLHRIESDLSDDKRTLVSSLRSNDQSFNGRTVLVVDDDVRNIFAVTSALEAKGLTVLIARDGAEALRVLDKAAKVDLVLMDIMMPVMDGYEAIQCIRSHHDRTIRNLPIVAVTAKAMKEDYEKCINVGANDYLPKPLNLDHLLTIMRVWLSDRSAPVLQ